MTATREAILLPFAFLTVALFGGLDLQGPRWTPPSLFALVLAILLLGSLIRSGTLAPERLLQSSRTPLANANGMTVLVSLFAASAQVLQMLLPREGLPLVFVGFLLFVLLVNALAAAPDRVSLLRSLAVVTGSAFLLKFVVLAALADPEGGRTRRVILALFDLATLGTVAQAPLHPASGYIAFFVTAMFLIAIALLPSPHAILLGSRETTVITTREL